VARSYARSGKRTSLVYRSDLTRKALNPTSHQSSVVVDITIWTPRYSCPLPYRIEEDAKSATLISGRIQILIVLRGELTDGEPTALGSLPNRAEGTREDCSGVESYKG
jgi:hypothetical protein